MPVVLTELLTVREVGDVPPCRLAAHSVRYLPLDAGRVVVVHVLLTAAGFSVQLLVVKSLICHLKADRQLELLIITAR